MATIIFDLDYTLLDGKTVKKELWDFFKGHGVPEDTIHHSYEIHKEKLGGRTGLIEQIEELKRIGHVIPHEAKDIYFNSSLKHHLFEDVDKILEKLKTKGHRLMILTKGLDYFQRFKIRQSGIENFFGQHIYICDEKNRENIEVIPISKNETVYFINDNSAETLEVHKEFPEFICIMVKSYKTKLDSIKKHKQILVAENIKEAIKFVK